MTVERCLPNSVIDIRLINTRIIIVKLLLESQKFKLIQVYSLKSGCTDKVKEYEVRDD